MAHTRMSDEEVIRRILDGHTQDFRLLVEKYEDMMFRTAIGFVHAQEDAEDICQEAFTAAYRNLSRFRGQASFSTWLYRITINTCFHFVRQRKNRETPLPSEEQLRELQEIPDNSRDPEEALVSAETSIRVRKAIDSLPDKQRVAFTLSRYDELSQKEIAAVMQTTEGAVEQLLQRAKATLRKNLSRP